LSFRTGFLRNFMEELVSKKREIWGIDG